MRQKHRLVLRLRGATDEQDRLFFQDGPGNRGHLLRRLARAEDYFRQAATPPPISIHPSET
jgi:hypothetical protein